MANLIDHRIGVTRSHEIAAYQVEHDLKPDGMVGPQTFRRLISNRDLDAARTEGFILIDGI